MKGRALEPALLVAHPDHPALAVRQVAARIISMDDHWLCLRWRVEGTSALVVPPFSGRARTDGLWQSTCFELFLGEDDPAAGGAYAEFNFAASERWAAYDFDGYREGMAPRPLPREPVITPRRGQDVLIFDAALPVAGLPPLPWRMGLSAVLEEAGGVKSYWALAHPRGKPDFHHAACFAARVEAPHAP
ncbi:hypothetical protein J2792_000359 [Novosphingobium capsulatum]|uniref:DOMON-like domain-containing protein n=1 Tax=Novosphingobium capsulatum TaxID=13688 RepID=A0ABU1MGR7_9SPHN|nr:DOMON-like domain-containing protein [Novosphingobium capsulatum]MDR6509519.1 hypothetical protein [Novosphingobium capsulatum]